MTDPERISRRGRGLVAELLRAGVNEEPSAASVERTLLAVGASGVVVTTTSAVVAAGAKATSALAAGTGAGIATAVRVSSGGAALGSAGFATGSAAGAAQSVTLAVVAKWVGIGVIGGLGLAGAATVASGPGPGAAPPTRSDVAAAVRRAPLPVVAPLQPSGARRSAEPVPLEAELAPVPPLPHGSASAKAPLAAPAPALEIGAPLAAEVAYVDRARALLAEGRATDGLELLRGYERSFPEARLLPEVLFLELETLDRLGRTSEAREAASRLIDGFPKSPHASRARRLLDR